MYETLLRIIKVLEATVMLTILFGTVHIVVEPYLDTNSIIGALRLFIMLLKHGSTTMQSTQ